jgi:tRNA A37 threonylcarbamoyladenosine synthetase subunit TsaC/SUA5/YrdC
MAEAVPIVGPIEDPRSAELAYDVLARGGVAVLPTDTLPGLSARPVTGATSCSPRHWIWWMGW